MPRMYCLASMFVRFMGQDMVFCMRLSLSPKQVRNCFLHFPRSRFWTDLNLSFASATSRDVHLGASQLCPARYHYHSHHFHLQDRVVSLRQYSDALHASIFYCILGNVHSFALPSKIQKKSEAAACFCSSLLANCMQSFVP